MAILPAPAQVARSHVTIFENFYKQVDPAARDHVAAGEAASFLKRSGLSDNVLSKIWDMSDPQGKGFLDKRGFFVALKLIALSQNGKDLTMTNLSLDVPPPAIKADQSGRNSPAVVDWSIKPSERKKYEEMFYSLMPANNKLPGDKVKGVMLNSKLPMDILGKIWDLSDTDQDGCLSKEEFILAMHLIYKALENIPVPPVLPPELANILKSKTVSNVLPTLPDVLPPIVETSAPRKASLSRRSSTPSSDICGSTHSWIVSATDKAKYDELFRKLDTDHDGFVTGADIKETLLQSGLQTASLAHIWSLCDIKGNGQLNAEQFALNMYLVQQKLQGHELPKTLPPEMVPPTLRPKPSNDIALSVNQLSEVGMSHDDLILGGSESENSELVRISKEIKELQEDKMILERDLAQKEADVKIRTGELKNCQNELEALNTMLKQLEMQKGEAGKRLNDLDNQKSTVDLSYKELVTQVEHETEQIEMLKKQKEEQKLSVEAQEAELLQKKQEVAEIKQEEAKLEIQIGDCKSNLDALTTNLQNTQLQISQIKLKIDHVDEQSRFLADAIDKMDSSLANGDVHSIPDYIMNGVDPISDIDINSILEEKVASPTTLNGPTEGSTFQDPFKDKDPFNEMNGFTQDPFANEDPFKSVDPFKEPRGSIQDDPFAGSDPFAEPFGVSSSVRSMSLQSDGQGDPFQDGRVADDPFSAFSNSSMPKAANDPFDPFGLNGDSNAESAMVSENADPFGADPFGPSSTAPPRSTSPTPALPPKKGKAPPPRPAPPKLGSSGSKPAPTRAAPAPPVPPAPDPFKLAEAEASKQSSQSFGDMFSKGPEHDPFDPFSNASNNGTTTQDAFADFGNFANFDNLK